MSPITLGRLIITLDINLKKSDSLPVYSFYVANKILINVISNMFITYFFILL